LAQNAGISLTTKIESDMLAVMVDRDRIEHVFDNLIVNAIQHTSRGGTIQISATADGPFGRFAVRDNGEGIPAEQVARIFEKFYRISTTRHSGGAGLGLAIVHEIITAHGGQITVSSQPGQGTTFTFSLPGDHAANEGTSMEGAAKWTQRSAS
jgi:signal transduction histidine kinase